MSKPAAFVREDFVPFPQPFEGSLDNTKVNGSWPALNKYGISQPRIKICGISKDQSRFLVDSSPVVPDLVPQVTRNVVIYDEEKYQEQLAATGLRKKN